MASDISNSRSTPTHLDSSIQLASRAELPVLADILARALDDDPVSRWMFPVADRRLRSQVIDYGRLLKHHFKTRSVWTIDRKCVAIWVPPNPPQQTLFERYRESLYMRWMHGRRVHEVRDCLQRMAERHPSTPYWYLLALATDPDSQGQGLASRLLNEKLAQCDKHGAQVALETSKESNLAFYQKFGFVVVHELVVDEGVKTWLMCR